MRSALQRELLVALLEAERTKRKLRVVLPLERQLQRAAVKAWRTQAKAVLTTLASVAGDFPVEEAIDPNQLGQRIGHVIVTDPSLSATVQVVAQKALLGGAQSAELDLGVDAAFTLEYPEAVSWLAQHGAERVSAIDDVTRRYMRTILTNAADEGWSYSRTAAAIKDRFVEFAVGVPQEHIRSRAELVAVTEVGEAYEQGAKIVTAGLQQQGLVIEKQWLAEDDACDECGPNADDGWIDEDADFSSGDDAPLVHPGCRCDLERRVVNPDDEGND